jgi:hypothetical protein
MKHHFDEDTLLKYQLELLEDEEMADVKDHINFCESCNSKLDEIKIEINILSSYDPDLEDVQITVIRKTRNYTTWLKSAAVLLIGFVTGYSTSVFLQPNQIVVVSQYLNTNKSNILFDEFTVCPSVDIYLLNKKY